MRVRFAREQVLARRLVVHDLVVRSTTAVDCQVLGLGLQNTPPGAGLHALSVRTKEPVGELLGAAGPLALVMGVRGAPHVVRRGDLPLIAAALHPFDPQEAADVDAVAEAMRTVAGGDEITRPALSGALNDLVDDSLRSWCVRCESTHVREELFRAASLQAGLELDPDASAPVVFRPAATTVGEMHDRARAQAELARRFVHAVGVTRPAVLATWWGRAPGAITAVWELIADELVGCEVDGRTGWALASEVDALESAEPRRAVALLPPLDPFLLGDRALVVPEPSHQRRVWRSVGSPGTILVDGDVVGTWRQRVSGRRHLDVTLEPFDKLPAATVEALTVAADALVTLRGIELARLHVAG